MSIIDPSADVGSEGSVVARRDGRYVFQLLYEVVPIAASSGIANGIILLNTKQYKGLRELF